MDNELYNRLKAVNEAKEEVEIAKAALFLTNPKIKDAVPARVDFLKSKGVKDEHIAKAIELATGKKATEEGLDEANLAKMLAIPAIIAALAMSPLKAQAADAEDMSGLWGLLGGVAQSMGAYNPKYQSNTPAVVNTNTVQSASTGNEFLDQMLGGVQQNRSGSLQDKLDVWLEQNPNPTDTQINKWASDNDYNVDDVRAIMYQWASTHSREH